VTTREEEIDLFWANVVQAGDSECMIYIGSEHSGSIRFCGKTVRVSRVAWESIRGEVPPGHQVKTLCTTPSCCNLKHMSQIALFKASPSNNTNVTAHNHDVESPYLHITMNIRRDSVIGHLLLEQRFLAGDTMGYPSIIKTLLMRYIEMSSRIEELSQRSATIPSSTTMIQKALPESQTIIEEEQDQGAAELLASLED
jgi:hypothetical protein